LGGGATTAEGKEDLLASSLAQGNIFNDLVAAIQKLGTREDSATALVGKVGARELTNGLGERVDETDVNDIHRSLFTEVAQTWLVVALSVVDSNIVL
jgi:hypothetical protein